MFSLTKREALREKLGVTTQELEVFQHGCNQFREMQERYNTPEYNAFGQLLRPHYCVHGVANLWADYDDICQYCEDGISTPTQWGLIYLYNYRNSRNEAWSNLVVRSLLGNREGMEVFVARFGTDYMGLLQELKKNLGGTWNRDQSILHQLLEIQFNISQVHADHGV